MKKVYNKILIKTNVREYKELFSAQRTNQSLLIGTPGDVGTLSEVLLALCDRNVLSTPTDRV